MDFIYEPPMNLVVASLLLVMAVGAAWRGVRLLMRGLGNADHPCTSLWVVRGIRGVIVTAAMGAFAAGMLYAQKWLLVFGMIFLGEELYETGFVSLALRSGCNDAT